MVTLPTDLVNLCDDITEKADAVKKSVRAKCSRQISSKSEKELIKALVYSWVNEYSKPFRSISSLSTLRDVDAEFQALLALTGAQAARSTYLGCIKEIHKAVGKLRLEVTRLPQSSLPHSSPDSIYSSVTSDATMLKILQERHNEIQQCVACGAGRAAMVLMGSLLEALLVSRVQQLDDKAPLFRCKAAPIDGKTKKPLHFKDWTLYNYLEAACEMGWISPTARDSGHILRDYRNIIHPEKERTSNHAFGSKDIENLWTLYNIVLNETIVSFQKS